MPNKDFFQNYPDAGVDAHVFVALEPISRAFIRRLLMSFFVLFHLNNYMGITHKHTQTHTQYFFSIA